MFLKGKIQYFDPNVWVPTHCPKYRSPSIRDKNWGRVIPHSSVVFESTHSLLPRLTNYNYMITLGLPGKLLSKYIN